MTNHRLLSADNFSGGPREEWWGKDVRCGVTRKMAGKGSAIMHHRHIHNERRAMTMMRTTTKKMTMTTMT